MLQQPMTLPCWQLWAMLKEPPPRWLCFKIGVGKARRSRVLLPKASSRFQRNEATTGTNVATLGRTGARCDKPRRLSAAVDRPHNLLLKGSSGWRGACATDYYTGNVDGSFAAAGRT